MIVGQVYYLMKESDKISSNFTNLLRLNGAVGYMDKRYDKVVTGRTESLIVSTNDYTQGIQIAKDNIIWYVL